MNKLGCIFHFTDHNDTSGGTTSSTDVAEPGADSTEVDKILKESVPRAVAALTSRRKLIEQWNDAHLMGKSKRDEEHLLAVRGWTRSARAGRRQA